MKKKTFPFYDVNSVDSETHQQRQQALNKEPKIKSVQQKRKEQETDYRKALDAYRLKNQHDAAYIKTLSKEQCTLGSLPYDLPKAVTHWSLPCPLIPCQVETQNGEKYDPALIIPYEFCTSSPVMSLYPLCYKYGGHIVTAKEVKSISASPLTLPSAIIEASMESDEIAMGNFSSLQVSIKERDHFVLPDHAIFANFKEHLGSEVSPIYWSYIGARPNLGDNVIHADLLQARDDWPKSFRESQITLVIADI